ncbi:glycosyltransferase family 4 protein [Flavobacterium sp. PL02]|uniref:glycosyltransferase family 4 protein n=1 Tax=Flavobacterium sp. PL02 TaxID=3088354 RepID=UPI002B222F2E|nr:glycosyltransferase family 4 protein [Flavobacterium sp. PL02]MEA9414118.1 glycosyltransferase family 4 protein [Flavobacterium sp. PL02]
MKKNILIISPHPKLLGGVANHYLGLNNLWDNTIKYEYYGKRENIPAYITFFYDLIKYILKLIFKRPDVVIINPSLRRYQIIRDGLYLLLAKILMIDVITFIHGWDEKYARIIIKKPSLFKFVYNKSTFIYVLSSSFKEQLLEMGITCPILLTTTKVDDKLIKDFNINERTGKVTNILFLARIEKEKGILIAINAFIILKTKYDWLTLTIVGSGGLLNEAKEFVNKKNIKDVNFTGPLHGMDVAKEYSKSDIYVLPTYGEGMPTSVLEAMAFGLPIITRPVGGLNDFFDTKKMGSLVADLAPESFAFELEKYILDSEKTKNSALFNHQYAINRFLASSVVNKIETDIEFYLN